MASSRASVASRLSWVLGGALFLQQLAVVPFLAPDPLRIPVALLVALVACLLGLIWLRAGCASLRENAVKLRALAAAPDLPRTVAASSELGPLTPLLHEMSHQLEQSQSLRAKATAASAYKTGFLRAVRHELRTPLNSILGFSDVLLGGLEGPLGEDQRENLTVIRRSADRLRALFDQVVELTLLSADQSSLRNDDVDPAALVDAVVDALERARGDRPIHVRRELERELPVMRGDAERLRRLLEVLALHALDRARGAMLAVGADATADEVILYVRDPSRVLSAAELAVLRGEHEPAPNSAHKPRRRGPGENVRLLMDLCERIAALHGGRSRLTSEAERGTVVALVLPHTAGRTSGTRGKGAA